MRNVLKKNDSIVDLDICNLAKQFLIKTNN